MSQPWSYYSTSVPNNYPSYPVVSYGLGYPAYGGQPYQAQPESSDGNSPNPPPPGLQDGSGATSEPYPMTQDPYAAQVAYPYLQYSAPSYGSETGVDAAQRWNAQNCSYWNNGGAANLTPQAATPTPYNAASGPRFPTRTNGTPYSVYPGPRSQNSVAPASPTSKLSETAGGEKEWSPELNTESATEKDQMEKILKEKIEYVFKNKIQIDWTKEPIPVLLSKTVAEAVRKATSINILRPVALQTRRPRGRIGGILPTGTLDRTHTNLPSSVMKTAVIPASPNLPIVAKANGLQPSGLVKTPPKRSRFTTRSRSRSISRSSRSSSSTSTSSPTSDNRRLQPRKSRRRSPTPPRSTRKRENRRKRRRQFSGFDSERTNDESDTTTSRQSSPPRRGRGKNRGSNGGNRPQLILADSPPQQSNNPSFFGNKRGAGCNPARGRGGRGGKKGTRWAAPIDSAQHRLNQRADRFRDHLTKSTSQISMMTIGEDSDAVSDQIAQFTIVGTMLELEKPYLRLTSEPHHSNVRPEQVLVKSLAHVQNIWKDRGDYMWACDQLKSIRQDLTVQHIKTEFTATVYEAHADIALEAGDSQEFHQCQSQLSILHAEGFGKARFNEFTAYRLIYYIFTQDHQGIGSILTSLTTSQRDDGFIRFALTLREAWALRNYKRFFSLACGQKVGGDDDNNVLRGCQRVLAWSLDRERKQALKAIFKAYRPTLGLDYISKSMGFESSQSCAEFIIKELKVPSTSLECVEKLDCKEIWTQICQTGTAVETQ